MRFEPGMVIKFTYDHQDVDASTDGKFKEVLVLNPNWNNKLHGIDLKRLSPAERTVLEAILDPERRDEVHRLPLVNDIKRRLDPILMIRQPIVFYTKFVKPFLRQKDAYRQYIPKRMTAITVVRGAKISTGKKPPEGTPLFGPKPTTGAVEPTPPTPVPATPIDIMKQAQKISPTAAKAILAKFGGKSKPGGTIKPKPVQWSGGKKYK